VSLWGRIASCRPVFQPASLYCLARSKSADEIGAQLAKLPHNGSRRFHLDPEMPGDLRKVRVSMRQTRVSAPQNQRSIFTSVRSIDAKLA
jgi:hypothetical protein